MFHIIHKYDLTEYTALIPSVGVGNVAQLSADLLISTLDMELIATVWHPAVIPVIGPQAFKNASNNDDSITTACELYISKKQKLIVFQIRSPLVASLMEDFFENIINFLHTESISQLIILTSSYAYELHAVESTPYRFVASEKFPLPNKNCSKFDGNIIHGGGFAKKLMESATEHNVNAIILFKYVSEGNNTPDAMGLIGYLNEFFGYLNCAESTNNDKPNDIKFKIPISWSYLYGNNAPQQLY